MAAGAQPGQDFLGAIVKRRSVPGFRLTETALAPQSRTPKHFHQQGMLGWSLEGAYTNSYRAQSQEIQNSRVMFCPAGEPHTTSCDRGSISFALELEPGWLERFGEVSLPEGPAVFELGSIAYVMQRLRHEFHATDTSSSMAIEGMVLEIVAVAMRSRFDSGARAPRWLIEAREILDATYREQITIADVAARIEVHPVHLATTFRRKYGQGIVDYIRGRRIEFASRLLTDSDEPLAAIAQAAGFCDQSHFSRIFKRLTSMTPAAYRIKSREN
jgi:AraC family transcriptional regulator